MKALGSMVVLLACGAALVSELVTSAPHTGAARSDDAALQGEGNFSLKAFFGRMSREAVPSLRKAAGLSAVSDEEIEEEEGRAFQTELGKALIEEAKAASQAGRAELQMSTKGRQVQELEASIATTTEPKEAKRGGTATKGGRGQGRGVADVGECARDGESCLVSRCCASPGTRCFRVNQWWAACNATCSASQGGRDRWDCAELRPAGAPEEPPREEPEAPAAPAGARCAGSGEQCLEAGCCSDPGLRCFRMNAYWASCNDTCSQRRAWTESWGVWVDTHDPEWDCEWLRPPNSSGEDASRHGGGASQRTPPSPSELVFMRG